ncbi:putative chromosome segregation protein SudA [Eremomyces bilateralis CBS 781.70]|uniref:Structural maintenance of chromosomes protein n=1 Tax=Eremomyces bilateralis CBS 781.70 TaxID=1392243 RepID=A0A6G1GDJ7_9PEZI|nr:putative chromosome segregation protein SudA [Eremomyces bilateralis CBS 781.70]KAF1816092.1 putative chromosome segregation protein SudA [Eremomyces bilateralis CBS 781.70]
MHIKQIIIQGFKSYKDQTVIEPFSPKTNVIVGRNGSGKSNFFAAIRFVLSDAYTQMGREERQALLHEGSGSAVMSAYVEIIFDNSDERFPTGKEELVLRRTIGLKKDEYSLDRKNATKSDVMNLLESAGFSRSNPYYIVPQGRVTTLTNMKDTERLSLLKEVAGTQVYETRRRESLKLMEDTASKREKIDALLTYIRERIAELEEEKAELKEYQERDRERRCLEYSIYYSEQQEVVQSLQAIEDQRSRGVDETDENRERLVEGQIELDQLDSEIAQFNQQLDLLKAEKDQFEDERKDYVKDKAKIELDVKSLTDGQSAAAQRKARHDRELREVRAQIKQREDELQKILPEYNKKRNQEQELKEQLDEAQNSRQLLYSKQARASQFKSKKARDDFLQTQINDCNTASATSKAVLAETSEEIAALSNEIASLQKGISDLQRTIDNRDNDVDERAKGQQKAKESRDELSDQRKELQREEMKLNSTNKRARDELHRAERSLSHMMDQNTSRGIAAVRRIKREHNLDGVYGTLAELFTPYERYKVAAEVTAGSSLFHYVVDTDETASRVLEILNREKLGRVTFMPLNRLRNKSTNFPKASDAIPLASKLTYEDEYDAAFQHVFGKTIVCPNLQICAQYARSHSVNAITPDGDRADKKGALTGGYQDPQHSRLDAVRKVAQLREEQDDLQDKLDDARRQIERKDQEITKAYGVIERMRQQREHLSSSYPSLQQELRSKSQDLHRKKGELEAKHKAKANTEAQAKRLGDQLQGFEDELGGDFKSGISAQETQQLQQLGSRIQTLNPKYTDLNSQVLQLESRKSAIEAELRENLRLRVEQLQTRDVDSSSDRPGGGRNEAERLQARQHDLKRAQKKLAALERQLEDNEAEMEQTKTQLEEGQRERAEKQQGHEELARMVERHRKRMDKSSAKKALLVQKKEECDRNIRDLGVLPEEAFDKYERMDSDRAIKQLHKVNNALKKYTHVNKKAFEQYANHTKEKHNLENRRKDLDRSQAAIEGLIDHLDHEKDAAIERTFKQVSREFAIVFERLVPAGKGRLIIQRRSDRQTAAAREEEESEEESVENYVGVGISVSFNSKHDEQQRIQQLSGGQKSLCALALVFAIQKCDPAPFYLFDEIDANLDAQYRTAVAKMLEELSASPDPEQGGGQFICTTFRPEMVHVAEKCYGVSYSNKTSSIDVVDRSAALEFVEGQKQ